eukprot:333703-Rhodomonas_salina.1
MGYPCRRAIAVDAKNSRVFYLGTIGRESSRTFLSTNAHSSRSSMGSLEWFRTAVDQRSGPVTVQSEPLVPFRVSYR